MRLLLHEPASVQVVAFARRLAPRASPLAPVRHLDPGALAAVVLAVGAIASGFGHVAPAWTAGIALAAILVGNHARSRNVRLRQPTVDQLRSLALSVAAILLAAVGLAVVAPSLVALAQSRLLH